MVHTEVHSGGVYRSNNGFTYLISKLSTNDYMDMFAWITIVDLRFKVEVFSYANDEDTTLDLLNGRNGTIYEYLGQIGDVDLTSLIR